MSAHPPFLLRLLPHSSPLWLPFPRRRNQAAWLVLAAIALLACVPWIYALLSEPGTGLRGVMRLNSGCPPVYRQILIQALKSCLPCLRAALA
jgi:hypothetical protein